MKILYSGFIDSQHSSFGGYHNILRYPDCTKSLLTTQYFLGKVDKKYHLRKIPLWLMDFHTRIKRFDYDITHLYYGEITMCPFFPYSKSATHKTVITLHLDIEKQNLHSFFLKSLSGFDGIIVLSSQQQQYYKEKYGIQTTFIPHGFDTPIFKKTVAQDIHGRSINRSKINLITSGKNYRDFATLQNIIDMFLNDERFHFHIVGAPNEIKQNLSMKRNVSVYNRLSDDEYYTLIQNCDYNFLPVSFATANNALLEAQALGIRSILPDIPGIMDYGAPKPLNYYYSNYEDLVQIIRNLEKAEISQSIIDFSQKFSWDNIFKQLEKFYKQLLSEG